MPRYIVLEKSFIDNRIVEPGEEVEYATKPGSNLQLIEEEPAADKAAADKAAADKAAAKPSGASLA
jgi:hypothetical protein